MLKVAMICMLVAVVVLAVAVSFMKKNSRLSFLLKAFAIVALTALGVIVALFKNNLSIFSILVILSPIPMILSGLDLKQLIAAKNRKIDNDKDIPQEENNEIEQIEKIEPQAEIEKTEKFTKSFSESKSNLMFGIGLFLTSICLYVATLYIGKETFAGIIMGLLIGIATTCILLALKRVTNLFDIITDILIFTSAGIMIGNILLSLLYSFSLSNILFCLGSLIFGTYAALQSVFNKNYIYPVYYLSMLVFFLSILL